MLNAQYRKSPELYHTRAWGVFCINMLPLPSSWTLDVGWLWTERWTIGLLNDCSCVSPWDAACWGNVCISCSGSRRWLQNPYALPKILLTCVHPQTSGITCCLPSKPVVGDLAEPQVHMGASFLPSWSCQSHILLSAAECLKILLTALEGIGPEPQHLIVVLSEPFKSWIKKEQSEMCSLGPAAHIIEGFYSLIPMGHCKPWLSQEARRYSPQERVQF